MRVGHPYRLGRVGATRKAGVSLPPQAVSSTGLRRVSLDADPHPIRRLRSWSRPPGSRRSAAV